MNEIIEVKDYDLVTLSEPPAQVLAAAQEAARALKDVLAKKDRPVIFNGAQYLEFEDWQTVGKFYGVTCRTLDAEPCDVHGIQGAKAKAVVTVVKTGQQI